MVNNIIETYELPIRGWIMSLVKRFTKSNNRQTIILCNNIRALGLLARDLWGIRSIACKYYPTTYTYPRFFAERISCSHR